jgi:hypothetical protein
MDLYDCGELAALDAQLFPMGTSVLDIAFPRIITTGASEFYIDRMVAKGLLAPFVVPCEDGVPMVRNGYTTTTVQPAYISLDTPMEPCDFVKRQYGQQPCKAPINYAERVQAGRENTMGDHKDAFTRTLKWMAYQEILDGKYMVKGERYPARLIDFQRLPSLPFVNTGTALWSNAAANPKRDIEAQARAVKRAKGGVPNVVLMGRDAWDAYVDHPTNQKWWENCCNNPNMPNPYPALPAEDWEFKGKHGAFSIYVVHDYYEDANGVDVDYFPADTVCLMSAGRGVQGYGVIQNAKAMTEGKAIGRYFLNEYMPGNGKNIHQTFESAPILFASNRNYASRRKVV